MIIEKLVVGPWATNCYIVGSEFSREGMIIDPGDRSLLILEIVEKLGIDVKVIVITHGHSDHFRALCDVKEKTGAELAIHSYDADCLRGEGFSMSSMFGLSYKIPSSLDRELKDGDGIDAGDLHFSVIHTPGHTEGGICLLGHGILFTGDTLFRRSLGSTFTFGSSRGKLVESIRSRLLKLPDNTIVYPGHGSKTTIGEERKGNPYL